MKAKSKTGIQSTFEQCQYSLCHTLTEEICRREGTSRMLYILPMRHTSGNSTNEQPSLLKSGKSIQPSITYVKWQVHQRTTEHQLCKVACPPTNNRESLMQSGKSTNEQPSFMQSGESTNKLTIINCVKRRVQQSITVNSQSI